MLFTFNWHDILNDSSNKSETKAKRQRDHSSVNRKEYAHRRPQNRWQNTEDTSTALNNDKKSKDPNTRVLFSKRSQSDGLKLDEKPQTKEETNSI